MFDAECVLCSRFFAFLLRFDRDQRFSYATAQSPFGQALYAQMGLPLDDFETNLVIVNGRVHEKLDAFAAAIGAIGYPWRILSALRWLPAALKDPAYFLIARNRYKIFGRFDSCMLPPPDLHSRFITNGFT